MALSLCFDDDDPWVIDQKIFDTLNIYLQPDSSNSAEEAAQSIDSLFPANRQDDEKKEDPGSFLWQLWERVVKTAQQIPHAHPAQDKLAALVKCLHTTSSRTPVIHLPSWNADYKLWEDLPMLGPTFQEQLDQIGTEDQEECQHNRNLNAHAARIFRDGSADFKLFAIRALAGALEGRASYRHGHASAPQVETSFTPGQELDCLIGIASDWITYSGEKILLLSQKNESLSGNAGGPLWEGKPGLFMERWNLWKERFTEASQADSLTDETKRLAQDTRRVMDELEARS